MFVTTLYRSLVSSLERERERERKGWLRRGRGTKTRAWESDSLIPGCTGDHFSLCVKFENQLSCFVSIGSAAAYKQCWSVRHVITCLMSSTAAVIDKYNLHCTYYSKHIAWGQERFMHSKMLVHEPRECCTMCLSVSVEAALVYCLVLCLHIWKWWSVLGGSRILLQTLGTL